MGKILRKIKAFLKRYIFKNKIIPIIIGVIIVGILLFVILTRSNVDSIKKVKKVLSNKYYKIECLSEKCDYIIAYKGEALGNTNISIYNANGKKVATYNEEYNENTKSLNNIYSVNENYIIFRKTNLSSITEGYILTDTKARIKYNTENPLLSINNYLVREDLENNYNIINKDGTVLYTNVDSILSLYDGKIISAMIKKGNFILNEKGEIILNGFKVERQISDEDGNPLYLIIKDSEKLVYYYYNPINNKIIGDAFNSYTDGSNEGEVIITIKGNYESKKYLLKKDGSREEIDTVDNNYLVNIDDKTYKVFTQSRLIASQENVIVNNIKNKSFGIYNIKTNKYKKLYDYKEMNGAFELSKVFVNEKDVYLQITCPNSICDENKTIIYDMINNKKIFEIKSKDFEVRYFTNYGDYNVIKYSIYSSDDYNGKYAVYNNKNKEILRSDDPIVIVDREVKFGNDTDNNSVILYNAKKNKTINDSNTLATKITIGDSYVYKISDGEKTYLYSSKGEKMKTINSSKDSLIYSKDTLMYVENGKVYIINPVDNKTSVYKLNKNERITDIEGDQIPPYRNTLFINNTIDNNIKVVNVNGKTIKKIKNSTIESVDYNEKSKHVIIITKSIKDNNNYYGLYIGK